MNDMQSNEFASAPLGLNSSCFTLNRSFRCIQKPSSTTALIHEIRDVIELNCVFFSLGIEKILRSLMTCGEHSTHKRDQPEKEPPPSVVCYLTEYELMLNFLELRIFTHIIRTLR